MLRVTKSRFYVVPVLMRTLDILELLCESDIPLKSNEVSTRLVYRKPQPIGSCGR